MRMIYDCEIIRMIPPRGVEISKISESDAEYFNRFGDGYEYCSGWDDFENMGISVIGMCNIDSLESRAYANECYFKSENTYTLADFREDLFEEFGEAEIWGFNSKNFDDNLCLAYGMEVNSNKDFLEIIRVAAYGSANWKDQPKGYSYSLGAIAQANGLAKTGSGELAPKLWQDGKYQEVINYCLNDCIITAKLINLFEAGKLVDPNTGVILK